MAKSLKEKLENPIENVEKEGIKRLVTNLGGYYYSNVAGFASKKGLPDMTIIIKGVVIQMEVKRKKGGVQSPKQKEFQRIWEYCKGNYVCGTCDDFCQYIQKLGLLKIR